MLDSFKEKYKPTRVVCSEAEKDALIKQLSSSHLIEFYPNISSKNESDRFNVAYVLKMTAEDRKALKKLKAANPVTARKNLTWEMLNIRNKKMFEMLNAKEGSTLKKSIKFSEEQQLELFDMTSNEDYVWLIHTIPTGSAALSWISKNVKEGALFANQAFISCSLQDAYVGSYAGNQSLAHGVQAFPISLMLEVDPNAIISIHSQDARTPEGSDKTLHLNYVQPALAQRLHKDQTQNQDIPKGEILLSSNKKEVNKTKGMLSTERLLDETQRYSEITVATGELAKDWGLKLPKIKAIIIEKEHLQKYLETKDRIINQIEQYQQSLTAIINFAKESGLPVILIDPKPKLRLDLLKQAVNVNDISVPGEIEQAKYFSKEVDNYIDAFAKKMADPNTHFQSKLWYQHMYNFLRKVSHEVNVTFPEMETVEEQVLLSLIIKEAELDANVELAHFIEGKLSQYVNNPNEKRATALTHRAKELAVQRKMIQSDLQKSNKELSKHQPEIQLDYQKYLPKKNHNI